MADDMPKVEFREFQEYELQNNASRAKLCIRRSDTEVGMVAVYHLGGLLGVDVGCDRWVGKCHQYIDGALSLSRKRN
jgi:hypothetical protein